VETQHNLVVEKITLFCWKLYGESYFDWKKKAPRFCHTERDFSIRDRAPFVYNFRPGLTDRSTFTFYGGFSVGPARSVESRPNGGRAVGKKTVCDSVASKKAYDCGNASYTIGRRVAFKCALFTIPIVVDDYIRPRGRTIAATQLCARAHV